MESFEYKGAWWFPQFPDYQVAGILKFDPVNGATLELLGDNFMGPITELFGVSDEHIRGVKLIPSRTTTKIILGRTDNGDEVTLYNCVIGILGSGCRVDVVFVGCHFEKEEEILFDSISIRYTNLEYWLGITGLSVKHLFSESQEHIRSEITYEFPERVINHLSTWNITFYHDLRFDGDNFVDFRMKQNTFVEIESSQPMHYNDYHSDVIYPLRNFLSLGAGTAVVPLMVKGKIKSYVNNENNLGNVIIYYVAKGSVLKEKKLLNRGDMLFNYLNIADDFQLYLQNWFTKADKLRTVCDQYFGIFYIPSMYIHLEFLTLAQVFETYHRQMYGGTYMSPYHYEQISQIIIQSIPRELHHDHRQSLKNRIKYGYEYSLRKRIKLILTVVLMDYKEPVDRLIGDYDKFIQKLVDTRNYLTHYTQDEEQDPITDPTEQYAFVQKSKLLMQLCFLKEMGLPAKLVDELTKDNQKFRYWSR